MPTLTPLLLLRFELGRLEGDFGEADFLSAHYLLTSDPRGHSTRFAREMGVIAPVKPTGGAIGIATVVAFAGAAACTQFLSLNMPFGASPKYNPLMGFPQSPPPSLRADFRVPLLTHRRQASRHGNGP